MSSASRPRSISLRKIRSLARNEFGFDSLRPGQENAIRSVLEGRNTLAILPTGGGKSAIYQIAGLLLKGPIIIVSPLIALQRDQVESMSEYKQTTAGLLNSTLNESKREEMLAGIENGSIKFLLLAPEQFSNPETVQRLRDAKPALFVVDEAHCVSQWGHDFRPDYARLAAVVEALGSPTVLALTATAAPPVRDEICATLQLTEPNVIVSGFDRPNIHFEVRRYEECAEKMPAILELVVQEPKPAIVYAATRAETEELAIELEKVGVSALAYHAGLHKDEREKRQMSFMNGQVEVMVATVAFGMGIDKPNVRRVWHFDVSDSLDSYYQEAGRAGRDGEEAVATLLYCPGDLGLKKFQASGSKTVAKTAAKIAAVVADLASGLEHKDGEEEPCPIELATLQDEVDLKPASLHRTLVQLETAGAVEILTGGDIVPSPDINIHKVQTTIERTQEQNRQWDRSRLEMMRTYAETDQCRRQFLLSYFGEYLPEPCGNCDNCLRAEHAKDTEQTTYSSRCCDHNIATRKAKPNCCQDTLAVGAQVQHKSWGEGQILSNDGDKMTVVFDTTGYKTLSVELVEKNHLLDLRREDKN